jgi:hypothetical protein
VNKDVIEAKKFQGAVYHSDLNRIKDIVIEKKNKKKKSFG